MLAFIKMAKITLIYYKPRCLFIYWNQNSMRKTKFTVIARSVFYDVAICNKWTENIGGNDEEVVEDFPKITFVLLNRQFVKNETTKSLQPNSINQIKPNRINWNCYYISYVKN